MGRQMREMDLLRGGGGWLIEMGYLRLDGLAKKNGSVDGYG